MVKDLLTIKVLHAGSRKKTHHERSDGKKSRGTFQCFHCYLSFSRKPIIGTETYYPSLASILGGKG